MPRQFGPISRMPYSRAAMVRGFGKDPLPRPMSVVIRIAAATPIRRLGDHRRNRRGGTVMTSTPGRRSELRRRDFTTGRPAISE